MDMLIQAALKLFTTQGFHATPTTQIAKEAKVSTGTLFWYFPTKEDLIDTVYVQCVNSVIESIMPGLSMEVSVKDKIYYICNTYINWSINNIDKFIYIKQYVSSAYKKYSITEEVYKKSLHLEIFEEGKNQNVINDIPTGLLIDTWTAMLNGIAEHFIENMNKVNDEKYVKTALDIAWNSIKK